MMPTEIFLPLRLPIAVHEMKSRIVGSLSEFAKDEPSQKADLMQDLSTDTGLSRKKQNHSKSSSTSFIIMLLIFRPSINLRTK
jgi:hypothetical protein